jgi:hypothetical protein
MGFRRHAKAPSAGSISGTGSSRVHFGRALAMRGGFDEIQGSSAPSIVRAALFVGMILLALLALSVSAPTAHGASKAAFGKFGKPNGVLGGWFKANRGLAVNRTGAGGVTAGAIYVADNANNRVQQFTADGTFVRAWGFDVVESGPGNTGGFETCLAPDGIPPDDVCKAGVASAAAGGLNQPAAIAVDQNTGAVYAIEGNNKRVSVFSATGVFQGAFGWDVAAAGDAGDAGANGFEFCKAICKAGASGTASESAGALATPLGTAAVNPTTGDLYVPDGPNLRINQFGITVNGSKEVTGASFVRAIGWDVIPLNAGAELEVCTTASGCQKGKEGNGAGQFINLTSPGSVAVDTNGYIYAANLKTSGSCSVLEPCGILKFDPDGSFKEDWGPVSGQCQVGYTAGEAQSVVAFDVIVDPSNNHVIVAKKTSSTGMKILEFDEDGGKAKPEGEKCSPSPAGLALTTNAAFGNRGLALGVGGRVYVHTSPNTGGEINILGPVLPPVPVMESVTDIQSASAHFKGSVTIAAPGGEGFETKYHFEYTSNGLNWTHLPLADASIGSTAGPHTVEADAVGLAPRTSYQVRLVATTGDTVTSAPISFETEAGPPQVALTFTEEITQTEATLGAHIDPQNTKTTYHFDWASEKAWEESGGNYANRTPAFERQIGSKNEIVVAQEAIGGLQPNTTYHFRVVARNFCHPTGPGDVMSPSVPCEVEGPDQEFETLNSCGLTDGRCFELVSPADKGAVGAGGDLVALGQERLFQAAPGGSEIAYPIAYGLQNASAGGEVGYQALRDGLGWSSWQISPPAVMPANNPGGEGTPSRPLGLSADLRCGIFISPQPLTKDAATVTATNEGKAVLYKRDGNGDFTAVSGMAPTNVSNGPVLFLYRMIGFSEGPGVGCDRVIFTTGYQYSGVPGAGQTRLYEADHGVVRNVGVIPGPSGSVVAEVTPGATPDTGGTLNFWNAVSKDASRIFFTATSKVGGDTNKQTVFVRDSAAGKGDLTAASATVENVVTESGAFAVGQEVSGAGIPASTTILSVSKAEAKLVLSSPATSSVADVSLDAVRSVDVSQSQAAALPGGFPNDDDSVYQTASEDGSEVFFTARYGLAKVGSTVKTSKGASVCAINGTGCDLYQYSVDTGVLTDLSADTNAADLAGSGVAGVLGADEDGEHVYFAARGQLVAGQGSSEAENLAAHTYGVYLAHAGTIKLVGSITDQNSLALISNSGGNTNSWTSRVTPDGKHLLFESRVNLTGYDSGGKAEAYLYDAVSDSTVCVSCRRDEQPSVASSGEPALLMGATVNNQNSPPLTITKDGSQVFFISPNRLAAGATEDKPNLYQWEDGQITFLSGSAPSIARGLQFAGASADGGDVYFTTVDQRNWEDIDGKLDLYDARVDGGFAEPPAPPAPCDPLSEGSCQGAAAPTAPSQSAPASSTFSGSGNQAQSKPKKTKKGKAKKHKKGKKHAKHSKRAANSNGRAAK